MSALVVQGMPRGTSGAQKSSAPIRCAPSFEGTSGDDASPRSLSLYRVPLGLFVTRMLSGLISMGIISWICQAIVYHFSLILSLPLSLSRAVQYLYAQYSSHAR